MTIANTANQAIAAGKTNIEVLEIVRQAHPTAKTTIACISYYRSKMKKLSKEVQDSQDSQEVQEVQEVSI